MGKPGRASSSNSPSQSFFWQGLLILLPLAVLACAGIWSLRGQRRAVEQEARQDTARSTQRIASEVREHLNRTLRESHRPVPITPGGEPFPFLYPPNPKPPDDLAPAGRFQAALDDNPADLDAILTEHPNALSASGIPLKPLILYQKLLAADPSDAPGIAARLEAAAIITHPSVLSGPLLDRAGSDATEAWIRQDEIRSLLRKHIDEIRQNRQSMWVTGDGQDRWRIGILDGQSVYAQPETAFQVESEHVFPESAYATLQITYDGETISPDPIGANAEPLATTRDGDLSVTAFLTNPEKLYAQQRRQTAWFTAIITGAAFTALVGLWVTRRAYLKQAAVNRMKSNFVSSVSHELRAPIASIRLMAERLRAGKVKQDDKRSEYFGFIEQESRRLATLVENVLDFSRIEDGRKTYNFQETDIAQLATDTTQLMQALAREQKVTLLTEFHPPEEQPSIDALEIQQALVNLIDNAIKYSPQGKTVTVGLENGSPEKFRLWVQDHGPGIPREEQKKIFQRFYRIGNELERETQGVGIGLAIVRHTAEAHGGSISVDSRPGEGSRFTLELPINQPSSS